MMSDDKPISAPDNDRLADQAALMRAIGFTGDDLAANQDGRLSQNQRARLRHHQVRWLIAAVLCGLVLLLSVAFGRSWFLWLGAAGILTLSVYQWQQYRRDLNAPEVAVVRGKLKRRMAPYDRTAFAVNIGLLNLKVSRPVFLAFRDGDPYVIYYAPHSKTLLSTRSLLDG